MHTRFFIGLAVVVTAGGLLGSVVRAQQAPATTTTTTTTTSTTLTTTTGGSVNSGVYTAAQAKRGEAVYLDSCAKCHLDDLTGGTSPPLKGDEFLKGWQGKTLGALFEELRMTMPFDSPGSLTAAQYADVLAYMLNASKFPAGEKELDKDPAPLGEIKIEAPK